MDRSSIAALFVLALGFFTGGARAQDKPDAARSDANVEKTERRTDLDVRCNPGAALRVQLVLTRLQDEKKLASLPYTFVVSARPSSTCPATRVRMRMGVDTPVPVVKSDESDPTKPKSTSVQYKNVGTNIDCNAEDLGDGRFRVFLTVENSSTLPGSQARSDELSGFPLFRKFEISLDPILRDGQSAQTVAATDPVTGEVVKIDVTMNIVK